MFKKILCTTAMIAALGAMPALAEHHEGDHKDMDHKEKSAHDTSSADQNLGEIAMENEDFTTLVSALKAADLAETVQTTENITIFAPTNAAFEKLPEGTVDDLLKPENKEKLQSILKYHVIGSVIHAGDIADGSTDVETLEGSTAAVVKTDAGVTINGANITSADINGSNGVIHVIDTVIMPTNESVNPDLKAETDIDVE